MAVNKGEIGIYGVLKRDGGNGIIATADLIKDTLKNAVLSDLNTEYSNAKASIANHIENTNNPHSVTKELIGLSNVTNDTQVKRSEMGVASGVATLDALGTVPVRLLPSSIDNVLEYNTVSEFPTKGESKKIYITLDTNLTYRWTGTLYKEISLSLALGETDNTAFTGSRGVTLEEELLKEITNRSNSDNTLQESINTLSSTVTTNKSSVDLSISDINTSISNYKTEVSKTYLPLTGGTIANNLNVAGTLTNKGKEVLTNHLSIYRLTLQKNGTSIGTFNPTNTDSTLNIAVPVKLTELDNDLVEPCTTEEINSLFV